MKFSYLFFFLLISHLSLKSAMLSQADIERTAKLAGDASILICPQESLPENPQLRKTVLRMLFDRNAASKKKGSLKKLLNEFRDEISDYASSYSQETSDTELIAILQSAGYEIRNRVYLEKTSGRDPKTGVPLMVKYFGASKGILPFLVRYSGYIEDSSIVRMLLKNPSAEFADSLQSIGRAKVQAEFVKAVLNSDTSLFLSYSDSIDSWLPQISDKDFVKRMAALSPDTTKIQRLAYQRGRVYEDSGELRKAYPLYLKAADYEAAVRIIAKIYDSGEKREGDSLLLGLKTDNEIVRYHQGKLLIMKGRKESGMDMLRRLAGEKSLTYYSVRAAVLSGEYSSGSAEPKEPDSLLSMLYDTMNAYSASKYFNSFAFLSCSESPSLRPEFARLYYAKKEYNLSIHFAQYVNDSTLSFEEKISLMFPLPFYDTFLDASKAYSLDPAILFALGREESSFNPAAVSSVGAKGVMQLMDFVYDSYYKDKDYFNVRNNIFGGAKHISIYMKQFPDNYAYAIMSYNAGGGNAAKWTRSKADWEIYNETIPFYETRNFVRKVLRSYYVYRFFKRVS